MSNVLYFSFSFQLAVEAFDYQDALIDLEKASECYLKRLDGWFKDF